MVLRVFGEGGCCRPAECKKKLVPTPSQPPKFVFLVVHCLPDCLKKATAVGTDSLQL